MGQFTKNKGWKLAKPIKNAVDVKTNIALSKEDYEKIQLGYCPDDMDCKWFVHLIDGWVSIGRSMSGITYYKARVEETPDGCLITKVY
mgnify:CR=1 FL=1